jgi:predicted ATPase with chaperone activity
VDAVEVQVEVNEGGGLPKAVIVGLPDAAVKESRDRVFTALINTGLRLPKGRLTISLAPADLRKEGPSFDLPIALGIAALARKDFFPDNALAKCCVAGELAQLRASRAASATELQQMRDIISSLTLQVTTLFMDSASAAEAADARAAALEAAAADARAQAAAYEAALAAAWPRAG